MEKLRIGNVVPDSPVLLAPMAGVSDLPFRLLCREQGAGLVGMEMISAKAILYKNKNTEELMRIHPEEGPVSLQLFGSDPEIMGRIAAEIEERPFDILDVNMGCPVPKIVNNGEGSALMKNPELVGRILKSLVRNTKKPVTVKFRIGFDKEHINVVELTKIAEDAGVAAVAIHGRTRDQYYAGSADWEPIVQAKQAVKIPILGNGDVNSPEKAKTLFEQTGCDGIMIARAARGNPWIFKEVNTYLETGKIPEPPTLEERKSMMLRHMELMFKYKGEYTTVREMRKHISWYTAGLPGSAGFRRDINAIEHIEELKEKIMGL